MLSTKSLSFSEILEVLKIDSGHLSYHLESLGDLIVNTNNGHYMLSSFGVSAVKLMSGVEEQKGTSSGKRLTMVYSIILSLILIGTCFHLMNYSVVASSMTKSTTYLVVPSYTDTPFYVSSGETFEVNVTIQYRPEFSRNGLGLSGGDKKWEFRIPRLEQTLTGWDEATIYLDSHYNTSSLFSEIADAYTLTIGNETQIPQDFNITVHFPQLTTDITKIMNPSNLNLKISTPNGEVSNHDFYLDENRIDTIHSLPFEFKQEGTYKFRITNNSQWDWNGSLTGNLKYQHFEKPYFYLGFIGIIFALGYIVLITLISLKTGKTKK